MPAPVPEGTDPRPASAPPWPPVDPLQRNGRVVRQNRPTAPELRTSAVARITSGEFDAAIGNVPFPEGTLTDQREDPGIHPMQDSAPLPDDWPAYLSEAGPDAFALARVVPRSDPVGWPAVRPPAVAGADVADPMDGSPRVVVQEVTHGRQETLRRWIQLDDRQGQLTIVAADSEGLRACAPGELAASLSGDPQTDPAQLDTMLADWLFKRIADLPQGRELGWIAGAAAWTCHMRAHTDVPPARVASQSVISASLISADGAGTGPGPDADTVDLINRTALRVADLLDRLEHPHRPRSELVDDWRELAGLSADVPELKASADWLLDQIALRDMHAMQLRAVLEPDITDHLRDRQMAAQTPGMDVPALDQPRAALLAQAHEAVRAYTAAAHSGRTSDAHRILDAFPIPDRLLEPSAPAQAWRQRSATAQAAIDALAAQRRELTAEATSAYVADPDLLHAQITYLAAREGQLHLLHDALGRLADPDTATMPSDVPAELVQMAGTLPLRRLREAFGSLTRAGQALAGQSAYLEQPAPAYRQEATPGELALLETVRQATDPRPVMATLDAGAIASRVARLQLDRRPAPDPTWRPPTDRQGRLDEAQHRVARAWETGDPGVRP